MVEIPRARLFEFEDHWGDIEDYHFFRSEPTGLCAELHQLKERVKSVFPFGTCVRLFEKPDCRGWSLAIYPGSTNSHRFERPRHVTFRSIGPCLNNEFSAGYLNETSPSFPIKDRTLRSFNPDLLRLCNPDTNFGYSRGYGLVHFKYSVGPGNRTEIIQATSYSYALNFLQKVKESDLHKSFENEGSDVLGHAIPTSLGGPLNEAINLFQANPTAINEWDKILFSFNHEIVQEIYLQFEYENENQTRPLSFYYCFKDYFSRLPGYGRIINGRSGNLTRDLPYVQIIPKYEYIGAVTVNLSKVFEHHGSNITESFGNTSVQNINQILVFNLYSCKQVHAMKYQDLKDNITQPFQSTEIIQGMIKNPMVRLYSGENYTGEFEDYHKGIKNLHSGCYHSRVFWNAQSSITFDKCIRLFEQQFCKGLSLAIYGISGNSSQAVFRILTQVKSVGPCLQDEFINASFSGKGKGQLVKNPGSSLYLPDLVQLGDFKHLVTKLEFRRCNLNMSYVLGPRNRIQSLYMRNTRHNLFAENFFRNHPKVVETEDTKMYDFFDRKYGDVLSYVIPLELCAPRNESFNMFPMSLSRVDDWARLFPSNYYDPRYEFDIDGVLEFVYENNNINRPRLVYYNVRRKRTNKIHYGRFINY